MDGLSWNLGPRLGEAVLAMAAGASRASPGPVPFGASLQSPPSQPVASVEGLLGNPARSRADAYLQDPKVRSFLAVMRNHESGGDYGRIAGGGRFADFSAHPNRFVKRLNSTAAGAYQFTKPTWDDVSRAVGLTDFSPQAQDLGAVYLLDKLGAIDPLLNDDVAGAIHAAGRRWDVFPRADGASLSGRPVAIDPIVEEYRRAVGGEGH